MRLGDRPDPGADRARRLLHGFRGWLGRRGPRLALLVLLLLIVGSIGVVAGIALAGFAGSFDNPARDQTPAQPPTGLMRALGVYPSDIAFILSGIRNVNIGLPSHFIQGALSDPKRIELDIAELDYQRLAYEREVALRQGIWLPSEEDYVPVTIRYGNQTLHGEARLKGDWADHWYAEKWSLRFKLDGDDHLDHMQEFALQAPRTRNYMAEWIIQQALVREGLSGLSYGFVDVTINGKPMGTYAIEEAIDDTITWYNREPPGPLLRFTDTEYFESFFVGEMPDPYLTEALDVFGGNATKAGYSENETEAALRLLEQWRRGEIPTRDAFDIDRTARYFAVSDLLGNRHGDFYHNMRFYYNPIRGRLEIIGHDTNAGEVIEEIKGETTDPFVRLFFDDPLLTECYLAELERISADGYLETLFAELEPGIQANLSVIYRDQPWYHLDRQPYYANRETIRAALHPGRAIIAYVTESSSGMPVVELGASQPLPVEVTAVLAGGARAVPTDGPVRLPGKVLNEPVQFQTVAFTFPDGAAWNASTPLEVECRVLGTTGLRLEGVRSTPRLPGAADEDNLTRLPANPGSFPFAVTDTARRTVYLVPGNHRLAEPLVVPEGYSLRCGPNTSLDLVQNAAIVARGPLEWAGTEESPVTVGSSDGTGRGVIVLGARNVSTLVNVRFWPLASAGPVQGRGAAITFLESPATLVGVSMKGDRAAPLLRMVDSPFNVTGSVFAGGSDPAVSIEYSKGVITEILVANGSGLRVAGSVVGIERGRFEEITGTAVLVERESTVLGTDLACTATGTALVSDSGSTVTVDGLTVRAGRAEAGFGPGSVVLRWASYANVTTPYVQNGGGTIRVDGRRVDP